jgi:hypothetical protein
MILLWLFFGLGLVVLVWLGFWMAVTKLVEQSSRQTEFAKGTLPFEPPNGFYRGSALLLGDRQTPWLGKSFDPANRTGINIFTPKGASLLKTLTPSYKLFQKNTDGNTEAYFFKTSIEPGIKDPGQQVFKLDYDSPENPLIIRIILDEMIETAPDQFLGKVHVKVFPGFFATVGFFGLRSPTAGELAE